VINSDKIWVNQQLKTNKNNYTTNLEFKNKAKHLLSKAILKKYNFVFIFQCLFILFSLLIKAVNVFLLLETY